MKSVNFIKALFVSIVLYSVLLFSCYASNTARFLWWTDNQYRETFSFPASLFDPPDSAEGYMKVAKKIADDYENKKIDYSMFTGDMIWECKNTKGTYPWATWGWPNAERIFDAIDYKSPLLKLGKRDIAYGVLAGNHDIENNPNQGDYNSFIENYSQYTSRFGKSRYEGKSCYGGDFLNNIGHYDLVSAGNMNFIILYMSFDVCNASRAYMQSPLTDKKCPIKEASKDWMNLVLSKYRDRKAIICYHDNITAYGGRGDSANYYFDVVQNNPNVFITMGGHFYAANNGLAPNGKSFNMIPTRGTKENKIKIKNTDGSERYVYELFHNYQEMNSYGNRGYFRMVEIDSKANKLKLWSESAVTKDISDIVEFDNLF